jgi:type I restriction enzyme, S subunit
MNNYSSYKDTNTPWIGDIPTGWSLKSLKHIFIEKKSTKNPDLGCGSISFGRVIYKDDEKIPESTKESYQEVLNGEFLINPLNLNYDLKSLRIGLSRINVVVSQGYIVLNIKDGFVPEYYEYLLRKFDVEHMKSLGQGVRQTISYTHIKEEKLVVPPVEEQNRISRYLDKKTSQIDSLVNKIEKKIQLLKEQRTSLINQCVTKGLNPNVEMKNSGVEWIGEIPKHWVVGKIKWAIDSIKDGTHGSHESVDEGHILLSGKNVQDGYLNITENERMISREDHALITKNGYPSKGDVLVSSVGSIGRSCVFELDEPISFQRSVCFLRPSKKVNSYFLSYTIQSSSCQAQITTLINQSTVGGVYMGDLTNLVITLPLLEEQWSIFQFLDEKLKHLDYLLENNKRKIELIKEYRQSLISSVVTGKVRVTEDMI